MVVNRNKLYALLFLACMVGYIWLIFVLTQQQSRGIALNACMFKHITGIPCISCGSTRSVMSIVEGNFIQAIYINPLGFVVALIMLAIPFWILFDLATKRRSLLIFYQGVERNLKNPIYAIPLILIMIANWIWNISKNL